MIAIIGMGFMGRIHAAAYETARRAGYPSVIRGVWSAGRGDLESKARDGNLAIGSAAAGDWPAYRHLDELLSDPAVSAVSICTYTDTHVELVKRALAAGKHVLVEKPVALDVESIRDLQAAAARAARVVLPGLCMRFWPGWAWLRDRIQAGDFGAPRAAQFLRTGAMPAWSEFYADARRSGNALFDLHIHDADFVRWCFGEPREVASVGSDRHLVTSYRFDRVAGPVVAEGGWLSQAGVPFRMRYVVEWDRAVADFDLSRDPPVLLIQGDRTEAVAVPASTAYELQVQHFLDLVLGRTTQAVATLADAVAVTELLRAERDSLERQIPIRIGVADGLTGR